MYILTAEEVKSAKDLKKEFVPCPEWAPEGKNPKECGLYVRTLEGWERDQVEVSALDSQTKKMSLHNWRARVVAASVVGEDGLPLFSPKDIHALGKKSSAPISRIYDVACRLSGLSKSDEDEMVKNSEDGTSDGSGSN